ncbi:porin [Herbaspirillum sp. YR522]|uniref:porin n=1 Tax=Herbaspirillum sp. YR522 TaxID=1144342 RepID=UPI00026FBCB6|nr:porin [Herbaspirillum sp. YR522]EJM95757.1 outer membrane protein (porin) [Herbaspirillum sp. YR522]
MNKKLIALALLGLGASAANAQGSVTIYGIVDAGVSYMSNVKKAGVNENGSRFGVESGGLSSSRIGFRGTEDLGGGLKALFVLENGFNADSGAMGSSGVLFDRKSVVGLSGGFGTVTVGRQSDFLDDIGFKYTSAQTFGQNGQKGAHANNIDRTSTGRNDNSVRYDTANLGGFTGSLYYAFGEVAGQTSAGQGYGIGANYANGPFGIGAGYFQSKLATSSAPYSAGDTNLKTFTIGTSYQFGPAKLYGAWSQGKRPTAANQAGRLSAVGSARKANIVDLGVDYALSQNLHLLGSVIHSRMDFNRAAGSSLPTSGKTTQFNLGVDYFLSKRTDVYAMWSNLRAKDVVNPGVLNNAGDFAPYDDSTQNVLRVGLRHKF